MVEAFQNAVMRLALCGLGVSLVAMALRSRPVRVAFARMLAIRRGLTAFGRFAVCSFLLVGILVGGDKTNSVNNLPPQMLQSGSVFQAGLSGPLPHTPSSTNLVNLVNPVQNRFAQRKAENWDARGAWQDSFWLGFGDGWVFPHGEPKSIGVVSHAWQQSLRNCARGFLGSTAYLSTEALPAQYGFPAYPAGDVVFKCNIFVAHRIVQSGLSCPKTRGWFNSYPPLANDWADASYKIGDWVTLSSEGYPEPGYVAADPDPDTSGHMGILDFDGFGISAGMSIGILIPVRQTS